MTLNNSKKNLFFFKLKAISINTVKKLKFWGHGKLTVMLVPHSQRKIFNFQVSRFTILFSSILIFALVTTSAIAIKRQRKTSIRKSLLQTENYSINNKLNEFIELAIKLKKNQKHLKKELAKLINIAGSAERNLFKKVLTNTLGNVSVINPTLGRNYSLREINELKKVIQKIKLLNSRLIQVKKNINGFKRIMKAIPSIWPIFANAGIFASAFGMRLDPFTRTPSFHTGVDILAMPGRPIIASADGTVIAAEFHPGNGNYVNVKHRFGYNTVYCHMQKYVVEAGTLVKKGQVIGYVGTTGRSTGYHLHYEVRLNNNPINPAKFLYLDRFFR